MVNVRDARPREDRVQVGSDIAIRDCILEYYNLI